MPRKKPEEWVSAEEAAQILTSNTDHEVDSDYVRVLAIKQYKIAYQRVNGRELEYRKSDVEAYRVRLRNAPRVRPRPSTKKATAPKAEEPIT